MSLSAILKNIYCYLEVIQASTTDRVKCWSKENLHNGLEWAKYCQQVYDKSKGKPYALELQKHIAALVRNPLALGDTSISMECFDGCVLKLTLNLVQNPCLSDDLLHELLNANHGTLDSFIEGCFTLNEVNMEHQLSCLLAEELGAAVEVTKDGTTCLTLKAHALLLYEHVKTVMKSTPDKSCAEQYFIEKLTNISEEPDGLVLLLQSCLLTEDGSDSEVDGAAARKILLHFIISVVDDLSTSSDHGNTQVLLKIDGQILTAMSTKYHSFFQAYLRYLARIIDSSGTEDADFGCASYAVGLMLNCETFIVSALLQWLDDNERRSQSDSWRKLRQNHQPG